MSWTDNVTQAPPDAIFGVADAFRKDTDPNKMNLSVGAYRDEQGLPWVLPVVKRAEEEMLKQSSLNHEYLPIIGLPAFRQAAPRLLFGDQDALLERVACVQSLSGTGALRLAGMFLKEYHSSPTVYVTDPTWGNHLTIFEKCGFQVKKLRYFDPETKGLALKNFLADITAAPEQSILVLHTCAHNPTGVDPSSEEWAQIEQAVAARRHTVIFDTAYQGYATGNVDGDAASLRYFESKGHQILVCQSFAKNMGLYGERVGSLCVVCPSAEKAKAVESRLGKIIRPMYSNPPKHGALIASMILNSPELRQQWLGELAGMSNRILDMRKALFDELMKLKTPGVWTHITSQIGMFSYTGLTAEQVRFMTENHHVYLLNSGRISMAGLNSSNVARLAAAMHDAITNGPSKKLKTNL